MKRAPITRQRSEWEPVPDEAAAAVRSLAELAGAADVTLWRRQVGDGQLSAIVSLDDGRWHVSVSFSDHRGRGSRYPRWDEIADARYRLVPDDVTMVMILPPPDDYVALHDTTFHLHELRETS